MVSAVFIDRDDTIAKDVHYCSRPEDFVLLPRVGEGVRLLNQHGFKVIVITNQSGIARGYFTKEVLNKIHDKMRKDLAQYGAHVDAVYYCPHHPDEGCNCRKPKPALIYQAAEEHDIEVSSSFFIGDQSHDVEAGHSAGCKTVLISTLRRATLNTKPDFIAWDFSQGCKWVVRQKRA